MAANENIDDVHEKIVQMMKIILEKHHYILQLQPQHCAMGMVKN
jgi:hypothetical protein